MMAMTRLVLGLLSLLALPAPGGASYAVSGWRPDPLLLIDSLVNQATKIDDVLGHLFDPPIR
jgi:hypothetical protein